MNELDVELVKARKRVKDIKKLKRMQKKVKRLEETVYKPHPYYVFKDIVDCFIELVLYHKFGDIPGTLRPFPA